MPRRLAASVVVCVLAVLLPPRLRAAGPQFWRIEGVQGLLEGEVAGLSVDSLGRLRLGAAPRQLADLALPNAWSVSTDAKGVLYVGTGNDGRVLRVEGGSVSVLFDSEQLEVHAVTVGPDGRVYAGTSPDGAVYAIDAAGKAERFFDPPEKYIWALAFDAAGNLYVATGAEGRVYRVARDGKPTVVLKTADTHVLSLALDPHGRLFAGSAPQGIVYRVDAAGRVFVVLDSQFREIRALDASEDGVVYAAAVDRRTPETAQRPAVPGAGAMPIGTAVTVVPEVTITESLTAVPGTATPAVPATPMPEASAPGAQKGAVFRIGANGDADAIWTSSEDVPHSLLRLGGEVLVGTGNKGKLYRLGRDREWTLLTTVAAEQVTALAPGRGGTDAILVTSNPARVYGLDRTLAAEGTYLSKVKDAGNTATWGRVSWEGGTPPGTLVQVQTRSGNTEHPDATWTDWSAPATRAAGEPIRSERSRFLQLKLTLSGKAGATPTVESIAASYLQRNLPPEVKSITVHPPGEVFQKPISVSGDLEILGLDPDPLSERSAAARPPAGSPPAISFSRKLFQRGIRTLSWQAEDPNGDPLLYDVLYRAVGNSRWRPLRRELAEPVFAWDTSTVPNGRYVVRIVASDAPGNPPALTLTGSKDSASFQVDNTPPSIEAHLDPARKDRIRAVVRDESPIRKLEFSVDTSRWEEVHPRDGIADSTEEEYEIEVPPANTPGPRVVVLRAADLLGNTATVRVDLP